jgi:hypothetical protein
MLECSVTDQQIDIGLTIIIKGYNYNTITMISDADIFVYSIFPLLAMGLLVLFQIVMPSFIVSILAHRPYFNGSVFTLHKYSHITPI